MSKDVSIEKDSIHMINGYGENSDVAKFVRKVLKRIEELEKENLELRHISDPNNEID